MKTDSRPTVCGSTTSKLTLAVGLRRNLREASIAQDSEAHAIAALLCSVVQRGATIGVCLVDAVETGPVQDRQAMHLVTHPRSAEGHASAGE